ncbi:MAG: HD-GYP domain-containing protein [Rhodospirillales bacterium]
MQAAHPSPLIAIISDNIDESRLMRSALSDRYHVTAFPSVISAIYACRLTVPQVVIVDEPIVRASRGSVVKTLRGEPGMDVVPVFLAITTDGCDLSDLLRELGAYGIVAKPIHGDTLLRQVSRALNLGIEAKWDALPEAARTALKETSLAFGRLNAMVEEGEPVIYSDLTIAASALANVTDAENIQHLLDGVREHDDYTYVHCLKVATMLAMFGRRISMSEDQVTVLAAGGMLHDIGKIAVPLAILNKPGRLNEREWTVMKDHVPATIRYLEAFGEVPRPVVSIAAQHHEKLDGSGYPLGLAGSQLNELARMAAIIDIFTALTDRRVYKPGMPAEKALGLMTNQMGPHLDPRLLQVFRHIVLDEGLSF